MKVARIISTTSGGAGLCVQRLHDACKKMAIDDHVLIKYGDIIDETVHIVEKDDNRESSSYFFKRIHNFLIKIGLADNCEVLRYRLSKIQDRRYWLFTFPFSKYKSLAKHPIIESSDIINLHWIADFVDLPTFFKTCKKPIVWTLHDENPARGGLHYACPFPEYNALDRKIQDLKITILSKVNNLHIVVQSKYMKSVCENSLVLNRFPISIINNGVDPSCFVMYDKKEIKEKLGLSSYDKVIMFSSVSLEDQRKGLTLLLDALERFNSLKIALLCVGHYEKEPNANFDIRCYGFVEDCSRLSEYYSAADCFVLPSFQESFAKTPLEAMACGTPVVAFPCSGIEDCIRDFNGVICDNFTTTSLYDSLEIAFQTNFDSNLIRQYVSSNFSFEKMAKSYVELYKEIIEKKE